MSIIIGEKYSVYSVYGQFPEEDAIGNELLSVEEIIAIIMALKPEQEIVMSVELAEKGFTGHGKNKTEITYHDQVVFIGEQDQSCTVEIQQSNGIYYRIVKLYEIPRLFDMLESIYDCPEDYGYIGRSAV